MSQLTTSRTRIQTQPIPPSILEEIETFEQEAKRMLSGEIVGDLFKPFRLQYGIYGQRQAGVQMVRIKIPFGGITANQLRRVAELSERYTTGVGHVTTRQDIQLHFAELKDVPAIMRGLAEVGLTTREACANTVRNVTGCHLAGVCQGEVFDITPYAKTVALSSVAESAQSEPAAQIQDRIFRLPTGLRTHADPRYRVARGEIGGRYARFPHGRRGRPGFGSAHRAGFSGVHADR